MTATIEAVGRRAGSSWSPSRSARWPRRTTSRSSGPSTAAARPCIPAPVKVADFTGDGVRSPKGLKPGDVVVSAGTQFMTEGLKVKLDCGRQASNRPRPITHVSNHADALKPR